MTNINIQHLKLVLESVPEIEWLMQVAYDLYNSRLHHQITELSDRDGFPEALISDARFIASVRNKLLHVPDYNSIDDLNRFERAVPEIIQHLERLPQSELPFSKLAFTSEELESIAANLRYSKSIEHILKTKFGAAGQGLRMKVKSVFEKLPLSFVETIQQWATRRNSLIYRQPVRSESTFGERDELETRIADVENSLRSQSITEIAELAQEERVAYQERVSGQQISRESLQSIVPMAKSIEHVLTTKFEAEGTGLRAKVQSLRQGLPDSLVRTIEQWVDREYRFLQGRPINSGFESRETPLEIDIVEVKKTLETESIEQLAAQAQQELREEKLRREELEREAAERERDAEKRRQESAKRSRTQEASRQTLARENERRRIAKEKLEAMFLRTVASVVSVGAVVVASYLYVNWNELWKWSPFNLPLDDRNAVISSEPERPIAPPRWREQRTIPVDAFQTKSRFTSIGPGNFVYDPGRDLIITLHPHSIRLARESDGAYLGDMANEITGATDLLFEDMAASDDKKFLAVATNFGECFLFDLDQKSLLYKIPYATNIPIHIQRGCDGLAFVPHKPQLVICREQTLQVWDIGYDWPQFYAAGDPSDAVTVATYFEFTDLCIDEAGKIYTIAYDFLFDQKTYLIRWESEGRGNMLRSEMLYKTEVQFSRTGPIAISSDGALVAYWAELLEKRGNDSYERGDGMVNVIDLRSWKRRCWPARNVNDLEFVPGTHELAVAGQAGVQIASASLDREDFETDAMGDSYPQHSNRFSSDFPLPGAHSLAFDSESNDWVYCLGEQVRVMRRND